MSRTACLDAIYNLAKTDDRVIFLGSDLAPNTMAKFKQDFPNRWLMEGIAEQNLIGMASGLASQGFIVYANTIASFLMRRCYEQIAIDLCAHNLPVRLIGNGGGLVYAPLGNTHTVGEDISIMRALPNMTIINCSDNEDMKNFMPSTLTYPGPMYIRLGKDTDPILPYTEKMHYHVTSYPEILFIGTGIMSHKCIEAIKKLDIICEFKHVRQIKPLNVEISKNRYKLVVVAEEGIRNGGLGSAVLEAMNDSGNHTPVLRLGLPDAFPHHYGEQDDLLHTYGLQPEQIAARVKEMYESL